MARTRILRGRTVCHSAVGSTDIRFRTSVGADDWGSQGCGLEHVIAFSTGVTGKGYERRRLSTAGGEQLSRVQAMSARPPFVRALSFMVGVGRYLCFAHSLGLWGHSMAQTRAGEFNDGVISQHMLRIREGVHIAG
jgi:hypothetical protein